MKKEKCVIVTDREKRELLSHGRAEYPVASYYSKRGDYEHNIIPWHWHEDLEILYMKKGSAVIRVPGKEEILKEGETALINVNTLHYIEGQGEYEILSFVFSSSLCGDVSSVFYRKYIHLIISSTFSLWLSSEREVSSFFLTAYNAEEEKKIGYEFSVRENLSKILLKLYSEKNIAFSSDASKDRDSIRIEKMLAFIHAHSSEEISLSDIASSSLLGEREALRCFRRTINESPIRYLMKYRLMKSADRLLNERTLSIGEIASLSGFDSQSYYSKEFKRFYGVTPGEYRKEHLHH